MNDDLSPTGDAGDPFDKFLSGDQPSAPSALPSDQQSQLDVAQPAQPDDPFAKFLEPPPEEPSFGGAFVHAFERGVAPAVGSLPAIGAGAETGAAIGAPAGPIGAAAGGIIGGLAGGFLGSSAISAAQDWALKQLPDSWQDFLGQSQKQQQTEAEKQPTASYLGGVVPYLLTMKPGIDMTTKALPANATALQRIMANPVTAHIFGGAVMGGMELGNETVSGQPTNWTDVAIATGLGVVFNNTPTRIGERLIDVGARPVRGLLGRPEPTPAAAQPATTPEVPETVAPPAAAEASRETSPTVAQAGDAKVLGPGINEDVFMGSHGQAPDAEMTAQDAARTEAVTLNPDAGVPSVDTVARRMEPELFTRYDALQAQRDDLRARLDQVHSPEAEVHTPESAGLMTHIAATEAQLRDMAPEVAAANRRAADVVQAPTVEPPAPEPVQPTQPAPNGQVPTAGAPTLPPRETLDAEASAIAQEVTANLIAAGRSPEEAAAGGQLLGHYYRTRSAKFGGALGSPMDVFRAQGPTIRRFGVTDAPLMPTAGRPNFVPEKAPEIAAANAPTEIAQQPQPVATHEIAHEIPGNRAPASELEAIDPATIGVDAKRFQFKEGGDEAGVSERLQGVEKWDPRLAGTALVYRDENGRNWVADGHQRFGLAKRLMEAGHPPIKVNSFVLDAKDGVTDLQARGIAAIKNIAEGTGSPIDAAKVLRDAKETGIELPDLPPRSTLARDGKALAELSPEAFGAVVNGVVPQNQGAMIGRLVRDPADQVEAVRLLAKTKPDNAVQAEMMIRDMLASGTDQFKQQNLFGEEAFASSIVLERAKVAEEALKQLRRDKSTFSTLVNEAERIQGQGANVLDQSANQSRLTTDEKASDLLTQLAFRAGPVSDKLSEVARRLKTGDISAAEGAREFLGAVRSAVESGMDTGADVGGAQPGAVGERPVDEGPTFFQSGKPEPWREGEMFGGFETERGLEGLPQTLIPGVKPMTDAERMAAEAAKPLKGGAAPAKAGSLFDVEGREDSAAQRELFQPAYHGTPHIFDKFDSSKIGTGEGAQAYGHGLYFASNKEVAEHYRRTLAGAPDIGFRGTLLRDIIGRSASPINEALENGHKILDHLDISKAPEGLDVPDYDKAVGVNSYRAMALREVLDGVRDSVQFGNKTIADALDYEASHWRGVVKDDLSANMNVDAARAAIRTKIAEELKAKGGLEQTAPGRLYHVDVPEPHELMDWDKPLNEQPKGVREKLATLGIKDGGAPKEIADPALRRIVNSALKQADGDPEQVGLIIDNDQALYDAASKWAKAHGVADPSEEGPGSHIEAAARDYLDGLRGRSTFTGEKIYQKLGDDILGPGTTRSERDVEASKALREAGIPGHQYVGHESQKTNYVVYDDSRVNVTNYEQQKRGAIQFVEGRKPLIKLFKDADASTFIHETGHQWLEDMMRDAVHPAAPDALKDDAQTVRDWLGIKDVGDQIATRQHEKFARGFEQYVREGVAPSPGLARVFAQFKTWLTQIYQSIKGLGTPINEDIRQVFDRLLAEEPNRTVISPDQLEREPSLASIHEADAEQAAPHEADAMLDRVVAERDAHIAEQPPEVQNELARADAERLAANAGPEAGAGAGGPAEVVGDSGQPEPVAPGGAGGGERGPELGGGGAARPEGAGAPAEPASPGSTGPAGLREQRPGAARNAGPAALAPSPADLFGAKQSPFTDKAGNIVLANLTSDQDVAQAIRDSAQENNDFIGERRGIITDGQVLDLADALGMDPALLNQRKLGEAFNAEQVVAARKLLIQSATDVSALMKRAAVGNDADLIAYAQAKAKHQLIQAQVAGITAEAGRALRAFRSLAGQAEVAGVDQFLRTATGKTLFQLKEEAKLGATLDSPMQVSKFINDGQKRGFGSMLLEYWINGLISGPATHTTYAVGNTILALQKAGPETAAAALIGRIRRATGREGDTVRLGEVGAQMRGLVSGLPAATKAAIDALRTGVTTRLPGETPKSLPFQPGSEFAPSAMLDEAVKYSDAMPALYSTVQGIKDGILSAGALLKAGGVEGAPALGLRYSPLGAIPDIAIKGIPVLPLGTALRLPSRGVASIHSFFRSVNYSMAKNALAYRSAAEAGLSGNAFDAHVANVRQNPTPDMMEQARGTATQLTLMGNGSEFVQALSRLTNTKILGLPILKFIDPFVHIAGNVLDQSLVQRTPLGLLSPELRADLMGKNGNVAQDTAQARMLVGTALSIGFGTLAAQGLVSGSGPSDPQAAAMWRLAGNQAHSVRIGDMWYQVNRLGPMGMLAGVSADMYDVAHSASQGDLLAAASGLQHAFTQNILDESFMRGPSELIQALDDPGRYGQAYIRNFLSSFVPYSVGLGQIARAGDPYSRQARSIMDAVKAKIPGQSETLQPRIDIWGAPMPSGDVLGPRGLSAIYASQISKDLVNLAMLNLGISPAQPERKIRGVQLTDEQYTAYSVLAGRMAKARLDQIVRSSAWQTWDATTQHDVISETITQSRETARGAMMAKYPTIAAQAVQNKLAPLKGSK